MTIGGGAPGAPRYASPVDTATFGEYRIVRDPDDRRPLHRFQGRISTDGSTPFPAEPGRYHLYAGWFCPWSQRTVITRSLAGLDQIVSVSFIHGERDGRGWAFRRPTGPDPINGFTLLRDAYDATEARFDGHISSPVLWDRTRGVIVSNEFRTIGIDLATRFRHLATPEVATYPARLAGEVEELDAWLGPAVNHGVQAAVGDDAAARTARVTLRRAFAELDARLATSRYLLGDALTEADVRLWVTLARFDVGPNAGRDIVDGLHDYPNLWAYARDLYRIPAFRTTTDFGSFAVPGATLPDWDEPVDRHFGRVAVA